MIAVRSRQNVTLAIRSSADAPAIDGSSRSTTMKSACSPARSPPPAQRAELLEQEGRCRAVLGLALLDLGRLLRDMKVQHPPAPRRFIGDVANPLGRTGAHAVRRGPDRDLPRKRIEILQVLVRRPLDEPLQSPARIRYAQPDDA